MPSEENEADKIFAAMREDLQRAGLKPEQTEVVKRSMVMRLEAFHAGPLPTVRDFAGYEEICPGAAREILDMRNPNKRILIGWKNAILREKYF